MEIEVLTLFPKMFENILSESILKRAQAKGLVKITVHDLRTWTTDSHKTADDKPFGGGPGMVMKIEPIYRALVDLKAIARNGKRLKSAKTRVVLFTPQGTTLTQGVARKLVSEKRFILICGHYEGIDERVKNFIDDEISTGDYILTCGEIPALTFIDCLARLIPGVLGDEDSIKTESFEHDLLEYPHYTRPADFNGMKVPEILLSGDHKKIEAWRRKESIERTRTRRPDLFSKHARDTSHAGR